MDNSTHTVEVKKPKPPYMLYAFILAIGLWGLGKAVWVLNQELQGAKNAVTDLESTTKAIRKLEDKVNIVLLNSMIHNANHKAFTFNEEAKVCMGCHLVPNRYLLRSSLTLDEFKAYVRGTKRHINNDIMPAFLSTEVKDETLESMYIILKQGNSL
jgi:hypothetical protein